MSGGSFISPLYIKIKVKLPKNLQAAAEQVFQTYRIKKKNTIKKSYLLSSYLAEIIYNRDPLDVEKEDHYLKKVIGNVPLTG